VEDDPQTAEPPSPPPRTAADLVASWSVADDERQSPEAPEGATGHLRARLARILQGGARADNADAAEPPPDA
jgi:hypothetical protein